ncbi:hypothetical protein GCM10009836_56300 [Pseudonocardia ailaonensis]|uniref:Membrane protein DUF2306 n=1 Tax=Pseudonocardia ailaonensis TaxID=367279 RepID=A0ABN2NL26_9PSEU
MLSTLRLTTPAVRGAAQECATLLVVALGLWLALRSAAGPLPERVSGIVGVAGEGLAALMIALAGRSTGNRRAVRIAAAVAGHALVGPLPLAFGGGPAPGLWPLVGLVMLLGVVILLVVAVRRRSPADRPAVTVAVAVLACCVAAAGTLRGLVPGFGVPSGAVAGASLAIWAGLGAAGLLAVGAGLRRDRPLLRRTGLAFAALAIAHAIRVSGVAVAVPLALELAATVVLLGAAVPYYASTRRLLARRSSTSRSTPAPRAPSSVRSDGRNREAPGVWRSGARASVTAPATRGADPGSTDPGSAGTGAVGPRSSASPDPTTGTPTGPVPHQRRPAARA